MIELITTAVMIAGSLLLLTYWFRYTCLLIVSARTTRDYASEVAMANHLSFLEVQSQLRERSADFDRLSDLLDRDYATVMRLVEQTTAGQARLEQQMLGAYYRVNRAWFRLGRRFSAQVALQALEEMSMVVSHFANAAGEAAAA